MEKIKVCFHRKTSVDMDSHGAPVICETCGEAVKTKKEYLVIGSNNFWYATCDSLSEVKAEINQILENVKLYGDPESGENEYEVPETLYIYEARPITEITIPEPDEDDEA